MNDFLAFTIVMVTFILTVGGVKLLGPVTRRLGDLLDVMVQERRAPPKSDDAARILELVSTLESRLALLEERQNFTEALLGRGDRRPAADAAPALPARGDRR